MSPLGPVSPLSAPVAGFPGPNDAVLPKIVLPADGSERAAPADAFGQVLDGLVGFVDARQDAAHAISQRVLLGDTDQLHHSVIAMQEASVAFTLMVEVRNKLVESYQELMRLQV
jgi:flagellar hook-basal body complex protein FliE